MTKQDFLKVEINQVSQVYSGKRNCCRCGCGGTYTSTSFMESPRSDINDALVQKRLNRAKKLISQGVDVDEGDTYIDIKTGNGRCLTFYFDEVKEKPLQELVSDEL